MAFWRKITMQMLYLGKDKLKVPTVDGKKDIKEGQSFECYEKDGKALLRMYSKLFKNEGINTITNKEMKNIKNRKEPIEDKKEEVKIVQEVSKEIQEKEKKEKLTEDYKKKFNKEVPVNKINDLDWIESKVNE